MLKGIRIKNLRAIKDQKVEIAPITVLYGPNGTGKSTLIYAVAILRNIAISPNQPLDALFNLGFANLGGFEQVVFDHDTKKDIGIEIDCVYESMEVAYKVVVGRQIGKFYIQTKEPYEVKLEIEVVFPYPMNKQEKAEIRFNGRTLTVVWNGILAQVSSSIQIQEAIEEAKILATLLNFPIESIKQCDFIPLMRGFSKPMYSAVPLTPVIYGEDEVATILANDPYLQGRISHYLEKVTNCDLRIHVPLGTATFWLKTTDKLTGISMELVNDGFGINQVVYLLTKVLRKGTSIVCIEEPEIHLHPKILRLLAYELINIIKEEEKRVIISTHSEHFVSALLGAIVKRHITPDNVACYLCQKDRKESIFKRQQINEKGQIEGGLTSFMEGELEDLKDILGIGKER